MRPAAERVPVQDLPHPVPLPVIRLDHPFLSPKPRGAAATPLP